jgi:hypothetical protein
MLTYTTASSVQDAVAFYQQELPNLGWQAAGESSITDNSALLPFEKAGETMLVSMTVENGTTTIQIALL